MKSRVLWSDSSPPLHGMGCWAKLQSVVPRGPEGGAAALGSSRDFGAGGDQCHPCKEGHFPTSCRMASVKLRHPNQVKSPLIGFQGLNSSCMQAFASRGLCGLSVIILALSICQH